MPASRQRTCLGLAVTDDTGDYQIWVVECRTIGMTQAIAQFSSLMDRTRCFWCNVTRNTTGKRELLEQVFKPLLIL